MMFRAILWDCDGVLIDSESLACKVVADFYTRAGYSLNASEYIARFAGQSRTSGVHCAKLAKISRPLLIGRRSMQLVRDYSKDNCGRSCNKLCLQASHGSGKRKRARAIGAFPQAYAIMGFSCAAYLLRRGVNGCLLWPDVQTASVSSVLDHAKQGHLHQVTLTPDTKLFALVGKPTMLVNIFYREQSQNYPSWSSLVPVPMTAS
jgi:phosphoglycolate phosphatase-like HAD superfamily hydrolase